MLRTHTGRHCPKVARFMKPLRPSLQGGISELSMRHVLLRAGAPCADPTNEVKRGNVNRFFYRWRWHGMAAVGALVGLVHATYVPHRNGQEWLIAGIQTNRRRTKSSKRFLGSCMFELESYDQICDIVSLCFPSFLLKIFDKRLLTTSCLSVGAGPRRYTDGLAFINM